MTLKTTLTFFTLLIFSIGTVMISASNFPTDDQVTKMVTAKKMAP